jgi:hypothetical protein
VALRKSSHSMDELINCVFNTSADGAAPQAEAKRQAQVKVNDVMNEVVVR